MFAFSANLESWLTVQFLAPFLQRIGSGKQYDSFNIQFSRLDWQKLFLQLSWWEWGTFLTITKRYATEKCDKKCNWVEARILQSLHMAKLQTSRNKSCQSSPQTRGDRPLEPYLSHVGETHKRENGSDETCRPFLPFHLSTEVGKL